MTNLISALVAEKLVQKGCEAFLACISVSDSGDFSVKDIRIVRDFSDAFPEKLFGLPPSREVEFEIELILGITPVSIVPYRMAPKELIELRAQIQELLYRGFIRPRSTGVVCKEEKWDNEDVYRLPVAEQANN
ncbi:reverse transcriptase [Gossypium australe]|uniref:Reverse transcriptase n=1 Tax=Gossypium australe TaxID=47621 RepID=A0A5B6VUY5_9ROSI|nr:reverse transcriptase [Gossypium australe]